MTDHETTPETGAAPVRRPAPVAAWHDFVASPDPERLMGMLAPDVVFRSPAVHRPQEGPRLTYAYLWAAAQVLGPGLTYHSEWYAESSAILEFTTTLATGTSTDPDAGTGTVDGTPVREVHGIDMIRWNEDGLITEFTVMARPLRGLETLIEHMARALQRLAERTGGAT